MRWIDEEGDKDLADSGLGRVFETEGLDLVLVDVREGDATTLDRFDTSKFLQTSIITGHQVKVALAGLWTSTTEMALPIDLIEDTHTVRVILSVVFWLTC